MQYLWAFLVGGAFCLIGQILIDWTKLTPARILVGYVVGGVILAAIGVYPVIADFAGIGASLPLTGFGNLIAEGVKEEVASKGLLGVITGPIKNTAGGIAAAIFFSLLAAVFSKPKARN